MEYTKIENMDIPDKEKKDLKSKVKLSIYIGETSRSTFKRGWEHLNDLTTLSSKSHMLKHILTDHPDENIKNIKFGIRIIRNCRTSFERQIYESVAIQQAREQHKILNSRSEYNRCSLPRLSTQLGDAQFKEYNTELEEEKKLDDELDKKIRQLRKLRNKERLVPAKGENQGTKRRKINDKEFITIQENWGHPTTTCPQKNKKEQESIENQQPNKRNRTSENNKGIQLTNLRRIENKIIEVEEKDQNLEWEEPRDWEHVLREHKERIEQEERELNARLDRQRRKQEGWQLYNLCKKFLEENNSSWRRRREQQIEENKRAERLEIARIKARRTIQRIENNKWEEKLREGLEKIPKAEREQEENRALKQEKLELQRAKENLWKLRGKENKLVQTKQMQEITKLDKKTEQVINMLEKEKTRLLARDKNLRTAIRNPENKIKKQELIAEVWTTYRWITDYLTKTTEEWEKKKQQRVVEQTTRLESWENKTRVEKIASLRQKRAEQEEKTTIDNKLTVTSIIEDLLSEVTTKVGNKKDSTTTENNNVILPTKFRQEETTTIDNKLTVTSIIEDLLSEVTTTVVNKTKNKENSTTTENNKIILPAKFKPEQNTNTEKKKQSNITKFFQQNELRTTPKQTTTSTTKQQTKKTTTNDKKQKYDVKTKTIEKRKGYWTQLALRKKQQDQEYSNNKQQEAMNSLQQDSTTNNKVNTENTLQVTETEVLYSEAFPKHTNLADGAKGDAIILESSNLNLGSKPEQIKKGNQITRKHPR